MICLRNEYLSYQIIYAVYVYITISFYRDIKYEYNIYVDKSTKKTKINILKNLISPIKRRLMRYYLFRSLSRSICYYLKHNRKIHLITTNIYKHIHTDVNLTKMLTQEQIQSVCALYVV